MTLHIARFHDTMTGPLDVFLDERKVAHLSRGQAVSVNGSGEPQHLIVRTRGSGESPVLVVTDPGPNTVVGVVVSYRRSLRTLFKPVSNLQAEFL